MIKELYNQQKNARLGRKVNCGPGYLYRCGCFTAVAGQTDGQTDGQMDGGD